MENWERLEWFLWSEPNVGDDKLGKSPNIQALYHCLFVSVIEINFPFAIYNNKMTK